MKSYHKVSARLFVDGRDIGLITSVNYSSEVYASDYFNITKQSSVRLYGSCSNYTEILDVPDFFEISFVDAQGCFNIYILQKVSYE